MKHEIIVNIEIPKGSKIKYEYDRKSQKVIVDRILRGDFKYPANYGYVPETLDWDGDELDVLVYSTETFVPNVSLRARVIGAMKMIDDGETDTKLIAVHADDHRLDAIKTKQDLPQKFLDEIATFFSTYKNWKKVGITKVTGFENESWAWNEYQECVEQMKKYGWMSKQEYIKKMKILHPEKYET